MTTSEKKLRKALRKEIREFIKTDLISERTGLDLSGKVSRYLAGLLKKYKERHWKELMQDDPIAAKAVKDIQSKTDQVSDKMDDAMDKYLQKRYGVSLKDLPPL